MKKKENSPRFLGFVVIEGPGTRLGSVHRLEKEVDQLKQGFSTSGSRPHLGSPSEFRGVARLSTNLLKNDSIFKY